MGARVPDLRGLFLRGHGGQSHSQNNGSTIGVTSTMHQSGQLGQVQGDATRNFTGGFYDNVGGKGLLGEASVGWGYQANAYQGYPGGGHVGIIIDPSRVIPTAHEIRPANQAVRYLIKAMR